MKTDILPIDDSVRSRPLGQKRGRGKPRKVPGALVKSPWRKLDEPDSLLQNWWKVILPIIIVALVYFRFIPPTLKQGRGELMQVSCK